MSNDTDARAPLTGVRAAVMIEQMYQEAEVWYPYYRLTEAGADCLLVGAAAGETYSGKHGFPHGYPATADAGADALDPSGLGVLVIPGGFAPDYMRRSDEMVNLVRRASEEGVVIAAICHGAWMLASAGIASGRRTTCFAGIKDDLANAGADYTDEEVVVDGNLVTSRKPDDLPVFTKTVINLAENR